MLVYDRDNKNIIDKVQLENVINNNITSYIIKRDEEKRLVDDNKLSERNRNNFKNSLSSIVETNNMLWDKVILQSPGITQENKILNKRIIYSYVVNQRNERSQLFKLLEDVAIIPYANGNDPKIVCVDSKWDNVTYMNGTTINADQYVSQYYGEFGRGHGNFSHPSGITYGREYNLGEYVVYPLFVSDQFNNRIVKIHYYININQPMYSYIDGNTHITFSDKVNYPYDISYLKHQTNSSMDKIWCSEADYKSPGLVCLNNNGAILHKIKGLRYENNGQYYILYFEPHMQPRISVYIAGAGIGMLAFTFANENNNSIAAFMLYEDGEPASMYNDTVVNAVREHIDINYKLTSVQIHKPSVRSNDNPYMWVTSGGYSPPYTQTENMVHAFAINKFASFAYLGSTRMPRNTDLPFVNLLNLSSNDNYMDILTVEEWSWYYGVRRYWPFADIHSDNVTNYCSEGRDEMQWKAVFTNECNIRLRVERKPQNSTIWEPVKIRSVDGQTPNPNTPYFIDIQRAKGWSAWTGEDPVDIKLKLPLEDYLIPGTQLRLRVKIFPEYINPDDYNPNYVSPADYIVSINNGCLPQAGGCPFIYVNNAEDEFIVENNVLNKSEFFSDGGDITDRYKLNVTPGISDNQLKIGILENETDHSYFDQIKLYAIDYNENFKFNITESNDFVLYNPSQVISTDYATLNSKNVITNLIQYTNPSIVQGYTNDVIYAHYPAPQSDKSKNLNHTRAKAFSKNTIGDNLAINSITDSIAIIALVSNINPPNPVSQKNWAADLTAAMFSGNTKTYSFSRRENLSEVIIPVFPYEPSSEDHLDHINVNWTSDFRLRYLAVVPVLYNEPIIKTELPLDAAIHSINGDVKPRLKEKDYNYAELQTQELINLVFNASSLPILPLGMKRDYVFEVNGKYVTSLINDSKKENNIPQKNQLNQNYPNPFNPITTIKYGISKDSRVKITIFDVLGREVMTLENDFKKAGFYEVMFDGANFASGVYFYKIQAGDFTNTKKMLILK